MVRTSPLFACVLLLLLPTVFVEANGNSLEVARDVGTLHNVIRDPQDLGKLRGGVFPRDFHHNHAANAPDSQIGKASERQSTYPP